MSDDIIFEEVKSNTPKTITITSQSPDRLELELKATSVGRTILGYLMIFAAVFGGAIVGVFAGGITESAVVGFLVGPAAIAGGCWLAIRAMLSKTHIAITPQAVTIGKKNYRRTQWEGFRPGVERAVGKQGELPVVDLVFIYGGATEKTGVALSAVAGSDITPVDIINSLNELVASIPMAGGSKPSAEVAAGRREQAF